MVSRTMDGPVMNDQISALMDNELDAASATALAERMRQEPALRRQWAEYHLIGDALRQARPLSDGFTGRVMQSIDAEPAWVVAGGFQRLRSAAVWAAAATLTAFSVGTWYLVQATHPADASRALAATQLINQTASAGQTDMNPYLVVHQDFSPGLLTQGIDPYARSVSVVGVEHSE